MISWRRNGKEKKKKKKIKSSQDEFRFYTQRDDLFYIQKEVAGMNN